jgi:hypothetical protein
VTGYWILAPTLGKGPTCAAIAEHSMSPEGAKGREARSNRVSSLIVQGGRLNG